MDILLVGQRTEHTRRGTTATVPKYSGAWRRPAQEWPTSHAFCCLAGANVVAKPIPFLSDGLKYCYRDFVSEQHGR